MAQASPVSSALREAFEASFLPLLAPLGLAPSMPKNTKPGLAVALATRPLADGARLELRLWCDAATGSGLTFRVDVVSPAQGVECATQVDLRVPWPDPSSPKPASLMFAGEQFLPRQSTEQLRKAIAFLAGSFAASSEPLSAAVPQLAEPWRAASSLPSWTEARERASELWRTRHSRGPIDDRSDPATVVFVGARLVTVNAAGERLTFTFDTKDFDRTAPLSVSGWIVTPAGTKRATRLTSGGRTWELDERGKAVE